MAEILSLWLLENVTSILILVLAGGEQERLYKLLQDVAVGVRDEDTLLSLAVRLAKTKNKTKSQPQSPPQLALPLE
ncbi:hypothetical protein [Nostoc sp.]|uniref:hypothetical protein n=1 Tax=Nostoc sp. TaxID=1180 RepID=UPI002FF94F52